MSNNPEDIKKSIDTILDVNTELVKKKPNPAFNKQIKQFTDIVKGIAKFHNRAMFMINELNVDMSSYDEVVIETIDLLLEQQYGVVGRGIIYFFIFERINETDGSINPLVDKQGNTLILRDEEDLWSLLNLIKKKGYEKMF